MGWIIGIAWLAGLAWLVTINAAGTRTDRESEAAGRAIVGRDAGNPEE